MFCGKDCSLTASFPSKFCLEWVPWLGQPKDRHGKRYQDRLPGKARAHSKGLGGILRPKEASVRLAH